MYIKENLQSVLDTCYNRSEFCSKLKFPVNGRYLKKIDDLIKEFELKTNFDKHKKTRQYEILNKECPVCKKYFKTKKGHKKEKTVCSRACSNTLFRSGIKNGNFKKGQYTTCVSGRKYGSEYRVICFSHYEYKCYYPGCDWNLCLDVHHIDENHKNNDIKNLIPLCPNHHKLTTINKYKEEVRKIIQEVVDKTLSV